MSIRNEKFVSFKDEEFLARPLLALRIFILFNCNDARQTEMVLSLVSLREKLIGRIALVKGDETLHGVRRQELEVDVIYVRANRLSITRHFISQKLFHFPKLLSVAL